MADLSKSDALAAAGRAERGDRTALGRLLRGLIYGEGYVTNAGNPNETVVPNKRGQLCLDTTHGRWFKAKGTSDSSWGLISPAIAVGVISGNASTVAVVVGFTPDWVEIIDTTNSNLRAFWTTGMTDDTAIKIDASSMGALASEGITAITTAGSEGFQIGTTLSVNAAQLRYIAYKKQ